MRVHVRRFWKSKVKIVGDKFATRCGRKVLKKILSRPHTYFFCEYRMKKSLDEWMMIHEEGVVKG